DYRMRIVKDVKIGESPLWMQHKLMHAGIRPIDLVVDITNYVMLEFGQPLHAFDYDKLNSKKIHVRRAHSGEELVTLDGRNHVLTQENLVITNGEKAVALAGVMGGQNSQITKKTQTIAIEAAVFNPVLTGRNANRVDLRSESSNSFKKRVNCLIGSSLTAFEISKILDRLGFNHSIEENRMEVTIPPRRWDIEIAEDLIEEIARIYGYNNIPITLPVTESTPGELTTEQK